MSDWKAIETAPVEGGTEAILWFPDLPGNEMQLGVWARIGEFHDIGVVGNWRDRTTGDVFETLAGEVFPTHWMPLPKSPMVAAVGVEPTTSSV